MRGLLTICAISFIAATYAHAAEKPNAKTAKLIHQYEKANSDCRGGSGDNSDTWKACGRRDLLGEQIQKLGWCYGPSRPDMSTYEYKWLPCRKVKW